MPAPTLFKAETLPDNDLFVSVTRDRIASAPWAELVFAPADLVQGAVNAFGQPLYRERTTVLGQSHRYVLRLDSARPVARQRLATMEGKGRAYCAAGKLLDDAEATLAYELHAECVALNSTAAILAELGVEVRGANPFPP